MAANISCRTTTRNQRRRPGNLAVTSSFKGDGRGVAHYDKMQASSSTLEERSNDLLLQARRKPRVEGVCFDRFSKRWVAKRAGGKKVYFPVYKYGFHHAYELAVHTRKKSEGDLVAVAAVHVVDASVTSRPNSSDTHGETSAAGKTRRDHAVPRGVPARRSKPFSAPAFEETRKSSASFAAPKQDNASHRCTLGSPRCRTSVTDASSTTRVMRSSASLLETSGAECGLYELGASDAKDRRDTVVSSPEKAPNDSTGPIPTTCTLLVSVTKPRNAPQVETASGGGRMPEEQSHPATDSHEGPQHVASSPETKDEVNTSREVCCRSDVPAARALCPSLAPDPSSGNSTELVPVPDACTSSRTWGNRGFSEVRGSNSRVYHGADGLTTRKRSAHCSDSRESPIRPNGRMLPSIHEKRRSDSVTMVDGVDISTADNPVPAPQQGYKTATVNRVAESCPVKFEWTEISQECPEQPNVCPGVESANTSVLGEPPGSQTRRRPAPRRSSRLASASCGAREPQRRVCPFASTVRQRLNITEEKSGRSVWHVNERVSGSNSHADRLVSCSGAVHSWGGVPASGAHYCTLEEEFISQKAPPPGICEKAPVPTVMPPLENSDCPSSGNPNSFGERKLSPTVELLVQCLLLIMDDLATMCIPGIFGRFSEDGCRRLQAIQQHRAILANPDNFRSVLPAYFRVCWPLLKRNVLPHETELEKVRKLLGGLHQVALTCKILFPAYPVQGELDNREGPYALRSARIE